MIDGGCDFYKFFNRAAGAARLVMFASSTTHFTPVCIESRDIATVDDGVLLAACVVDDAETPAEKPRIKPQ